MEGDVQSKVGQIRAQVKRYLLKEISEEAIYQTLQERGLDIHPAQEGTYVWLVNFNQPLSDAQKELLIEMPKHHAVDPPEVEPEQIRIHGFDLECIPALLTQLVEHELL